MKSKVDSTVNNTSPNQDSIIKYDQLVDFSEQNNEDIIKMFSDSLSSEKDSDGLDSFEKNDKDVISNDALISLISEENNKIKKRKENFSLFKTLNFPKINVDKIYTELIEYYGVVKDVDYDNGFFSVVFEKNSDMVKSLTTFSLSDLSFDCDVNKIKKGSELIIIKGRKQDVCMNNGRQKKKSGASKFIDIYLLTESQLTSKEKEIANNKINKWANI